MSDRPAKRVGIVTGERWPDLTDDGRALAAALDDRGLDAEPVVWSDPERDPTDLDAALVRSCFGYHERADDFHEWIADLAESGVTVLNPPEAIRWNAHKSYLRELAEAGVSTIPTTWIDQGAHPDLLSVLRASEFDRAVVKPAVGTSSEGVFETSIQAAPGHRDRFDSLVDDGDVLVQAFAPEISDGEVSLVYFGGEYSYANRSIPADDDFRTHHQFGGTTERYDPPAETIQAATDALAAARRILDLSAEDLPYARVDGIERESGFQVVELELVEPYLGLLRETGAVEEFANAVATALERRGIHPAPV